jgi:hypothetical protein
MRLRLPNTLRKLADWDMRLELIAIALIFVAGLVVFLMEDCGGTRNAIESSFSTELPSNAP